MAATRLLIKGKKNAKIYLRFYNGKAFDFQAWTGLLIPAAHWDAKKQRLRNLSEIQNRDELNTKLGKLELAILDAYNAAYTTGDIINKLWLENATQAFFNRPKGEVKLKVEPYKLYLTDFARWWLDNKADTYKISSGKYLSTVSKMQYEQILNNLIAFEGKNKILLRKIDGEVLDKFSAFMTDTEGYTYMTVSRKITRVKFFCERAEELGIDVSKGYKSTVYVKPDEQEIMEPYLNEQEIAKIFKADLSHDQELSNVRDNWIIGLWTGLRVSDFLTRLSTDNIQDGYIEIKTLKTKASVSIPLHPQVKEILKKHNGQLPEKISEPKFNKKIKTIAQIVEIDQEMLGAVAKKQDGTGKIRKEVGIYKKYELISSHICRRSMATNLFTKIPNAVIMSVCGWSSEEMLLRYIKKTNRENANILKKHWEEQQY